MAQLLARFLGLGPLLSLGKLDLDKGIMDYLSRVAERFPLWNAGGFLALAGVWVWFLTRLDEAARTHVESCRHLWESTSTFERELQKVRSRARLVYSFFLVICLIAALVIVYAHVVL